MLTRRDAAAATGAGVAILGQAAETAAGGALGNIRINIIAVANIAGTAAACRAYPVNRAAQLGENRGADDCGTGCDGAPARGRRDHAGTPAVECRIYIVQFVTQVIDLDLTDKRGSGYDSGVVAILGPGCRGKAIIRAFGVNPRAQFVNVDLTNVDAGAGDIRPAVKHPGRGDQSAQKCALDGPTEIFTALIR